MTYKNIPFDDTWTLTNGRTNNGILESTNDGFEALSDYIDVNGGFFYFTFDSYTETYAPYWTERYGNRGGVRLDQLYFDANKTETSCLNGATFNDSAISFPINEWNNDLLWNDVNAWRDSERYGEIEITDIV